MVSRVIDRFNNLTKSHPNPNCDFWTRLTLLIYHVYERPIVAIMPIFESSQRKDCFIRPKKWCLGNFGSPSIIQILSHYPCDGRSLPEKSLARNAVYMTFIAVLQNFSVWYDNPVSRASSRSDFFGLRIKLPALLLCSLQPLMLMAFLFFLYLPLNLWSITFDGRLW